ncbi:2-keto-myo-inositol dehydratase [Megamonas hypermegale ART12/1]|nr:2-keto-myo-inositol dehydratase [Megamonas hypermegale ART12/1]
MTNIKLGICPIGWTNDDMPDLGKENTFQQCVSEMALAGFTGCEMGGKFPKDVDVLKKALALRGLSVASAWFSSFLTTKPYEETAAAFKAHRDFLHAMGAKVVVVSEQGNSIQGQLSTPLFANKPHNTDEEWKLVAEGLNKLGALAAEKDMKLVYHHHMGTGVQTEAEIDKLMEMTDPNLVFLLYDTGHLVCSGEDYIGILKKYVNRIKHVHLKDVRKELVEKVKTKI